MRSSFVGALDARGSRRSCFICPVMGSMTVRFALAERSATFARAFMDAPESSAASVGLLCWEGRTGIGNDACSAAGRVARAACFACLWALRACLRAVTECTRPLCDRCGFSSPPLIPSSARSAAGNRVVERERSLPLRPDMDEKFCGGNKRFIQKCPLFSPTCPLRPVAAPSTCRPMFRAHVVRRVQARQTRPIERRLATSITALAALP